MEDKRIKECWVLLQDCCATLPMLAAKSEPVTEYKDESLPFQGCHSSNSLFSNAHNSESDTFISQEPSCHSKCSPVKRVSKGEKRLIKGKRVRGLKDRLHKVKHKKRNMPVNKLISLASNHAKRHLFQKYGEGLLRKPSFSVETVSGKQELSYLDTLKGKVNDNSSSRTANSGIGYPLQSPSLININNNGKDTMLGINRTQVKHQSAPKTFSKSVDKNDLKKTETSSKSDETASAPSRHECKLSNSDPKNDSPISSSDNKSVSGCVKDITCLSNSAIKSDPIPEVIQSNSKSYYTNPSSPMPSVGLLLDVGIAHVLLPQQAKCVLHCLDECKDSLTSQYAEFCSSVVKNSSKPLVKSMILPVNNKRILNIMEYKWKSRSVVKLSKPDTLNAIFSCSKPCRITSTSAHLSNDNIEKSDQLSIPNVAKATRDQRILSPEVEQRRKPQDIRNRKTRSRKRRWWGKSDPMSKRPVLEFDTAGDPKTKVTYVDLVGSDISPESGASDDQVACLPLTVKSPHKITLLSADRDKTHTSDLSCKGAEEDPFHSSNRRRSRRSAGKAVLQDNLSERFKIGSDDEARTVDLKTIAHIPEPLFDPDDTRGINESEGTAKDCKELTRDRSSLEHELRRLNVALFDMSNGPEPILCKTPDICRLGCVCSSISKPVVRDNCGLVKCMFECSCIDPQPSCKVDTTLSFTWAQNKAKANLAKEEQNFKQTVVRSGSDNIIHVEGKRKRQIKLPGRYREDFFISDNELALRQASKKLIKSPETERSDQACNMLQSTKGSKTNNQTSNISEKNLSGNQESRPFTGESNYPLVSKRLVFSKEELKLSRNKRITEHTPERNVAMIRTNKQPVKDDDCYSARVRPHSLGSKEDRIAMRKIFQENSTSNKMDPAEELRIASTNSLQLSDWNELEGDTLNGKKSCSFLFDPNDEESKRKEVVLLPWETLHTDIEQKRIYLWLKTKSKSKIYITKDYIKPSQDCVELQTIDFSSEEYKNLPFHLKILRTGYRPSTIEEKCTWIAKYQNQAKYENAHWMIVGYLQPGHKSADACASVCETQEVDIASSLEEDIPCRWWVMNIGQNFDLLYFLDFKKAITKAQITTLAKLSNEYAEKDSQVHRIILNRRRPKVDPTAVPNPDFGAYSLPKRPNEVLIGPYYSFKEPRFRVYTKKVALNGKEEYEAVPLFYCGNGGSVRVNPQGVLSLHSESLPDKYVLGTWIPDFLNCRSDPYHPLTDIRQRTKQCITGGTTKVPDLVDLTESESIEGEGGKNISLGIDDLVIQEKLRGSLEDTCSGLNKKADFGRNSNRSLLRTNLEKDRKNCIDSSSDGYAEENLTKPTSSGTVNTKKRSTATVNGRVQALPGSNQAKSAHPRRPQQRPIMTTSESSHFTGPVEPINPANDSSTAENVEIEYLIPSEQDIGYLTLTRLPRSVISVCHFTKPGALTFHRTKTEIKKQINHLVHNRLACMTRKCSFYFINEVCRCVTWSSSSNKPVGLKKFNCKIFNGFYMLTKSGLLDLRSADDATIRMLGKDWIEWLKDDEIRLKLADWKMKEEQELSMRHNSLSEILGQKSMPLPLVLQWAKSEIAKLKAEGQLLDHESQTQQLLKDTLMYSLSRELNGIPNGVMPHFLQKLDLDLLWDVLECMESRDTKPPPAESPPPGQFLFTSNGESNNHSHQSKELSPSKMRPPIILRKNKFLNDNYIPPGNFSIGSNQGQKQARKQVFSKVIEKEEEPIFLVESEPCLPAETATSPPFSQTAMSNVELIPELGRQTNAFHPQTTVNADANLHLSSVHSGSMAALSSLSARVEDSSTVGTVEQTDPIPSLRISSVRSGADTLFSSLCPSTEDSNSLSGSVPGASKEGDPLSSLQITSVYSVLQPDVSSTCDQVSSVVSSSQPRVVKNVDPISSLCISSVYSGAKIPHKMRGTKPCLSSSTSSTISSVEEQTDSSMPLRISSVYSTGQAELLSKSSSTKVPSTSSISKCNVKDSDPISSLRISSVFSETKSNLAISSIPASNFSPSRDIQKKLSDCHGASTSNQIEFISPEQKLTQNLSRKLAISTTVGTIKHLTVIPKVIEAGNKDNSVQPSQKKIHTTFTKPPAISTSVGSLRHLAVKPNDGIKPLKFGQQPSVVKETASIKVPASSLRKIDASVFKTLKDLSHKK